MGTLCFAHPTRGGMMSGRYKAYAEYKDSGVEWLGAIPNQWKLCPLKFMAKIRNGQDYKSVEVAEGYPVIGSGGQFTYASKFTYDQESVLLGRKGTIDKPLYINEPFWTVDTMYYTEINQNINPKFLYYLALTIQFGRYSTNTALPSMTQEHLGNYVFAIPDDVHERKIIANFLDHETAKIDALIDKQQQLIKLLKEKRQAVISHAVTKGLSPDAPMRESGVEWLGEVPAHWKVCRIKQVAKLESGHTPDKKIEAYWVDCDIPWVSLNDSTQLKTVDYISDTAFNLNEQGIANSSARKLPERCVVFTRDASIGLAAITTRVMAVSQHVIAWICDEEKVIPEYLLLIFYAMKDELERYTLGATLKTIGMPDVNKLTGAFPELDEQKRIVEHVFRIKENIDITVSKAEDAVKIIKERRTALISAAVTGKIDVRNWHTPASFRNHKEAAA
jgi:type I restriction enzyme S subunit